MKRNLESKLGKEEIQSALNEYDDKNSEYYYRTLNKLSGTSDAGVAMEIAYPIDKDTGKIVKEDVAAVTTLNGKVFLVYLRRDCEERKTEVHYVMGRKGILLEGVTLIDDEKYHDFDIHCWIKYRGGYKIWPHKESISKKKLPGFVKIL